MCISIVVCRLYYNNYCFGRHGIRDDKSGVKPQGSALTLHSPNLLSIRINVQPHKPSRKLAGAQYHAPNNAHTVLRDGLALTSKFRRISVPRHATDVTSMLKYFK